MNHRLHRIKNYQDGIEQDLRTRSQKIILVTRQQGG